MTLNYNNYLLLLIFSEIIIIYLGAYVIKNKPYKIMVETIILFFLLFLFIFGNMMETNNTNINRQIFWSNIQYITYGFLPFVWFIIVLKMNDNKKWMALKKLLLLAIFPTLAVIGVWTNDLHGLFRESYSLIRKDSFLILHNEYGPWFWFLVSQSYLFLAISGALLLKNLIKKGKIYQGQSAFFLVSMVIIWTPNLLNTTGIYNFGFDLSPIFTGIAGIVVFLGLQRYYIFDLIPVTRKMVVEELGMGVIVLDNRYRVLDINSKAKKMLKIEERFVAGRVLPEVIIKRLGFNIKKNEEATFIDKGKLKTKIYDGEKCFEIKVKPFTRDTGGLSVWVLILNDITDLEKAREQVIKQQKELAVAEERNRVTRDLHDNLGQVISYANLQTQSIKQELKNNNNLIAIRQLNDLIDNLKKGHQNMRTYIYNNREASILKKSFIKLIEEELTVFEDNTGIKPVLNISEDVAEILQRSESRIHLFYILKEGLNNIIKHTSATEVSLSFAKEGDNLEMVIEDNGKGLLKGDYRNKKSSGLAIMDERAKFMNGSLFLESEEGKGVKLQFQIPAEDT